MGREREGGGKERMRIRFTAESRKKGILGASWVYTRKNINSSFHGRNFPEPTLSRDKTSAKKGKKERKEERA